VLIKKLNKNGKKVTTNDDNIENMNTNNIPKKKSKSKDKQPSQKKNINRSSRLSSTNPLSQGKEEEVLSTLVENIQSN
jgi:hypothetical protein